MFHQSFKNKLLQLNSEDETKLFEEKAKLLDKFYRKLGMSSEISELDPEMIKDFADLTYLIRRPTPPECCILLRTTALRHLKRASVNQVQTFEKILKHFDCI